METAIDKNESELDKMKRESLEWIERYGKTAPPFISVAVNAFRPLPEQESKELTDLKQYVTNLLYIAHDVPITGTEFGKWVEEKINNLDHYAQSHPEAREMPSDNDLCIKLKNKLIEYLLRNKDTLDNNYLVIGEIPFTRREIADEIQRNTEIGIRMLADMVFLAFDITSRGKNK